MVFQHFSLFEALSAAENIALSLNDQTPISTIAAKAKALSYSYGLPLDPYSLVGDLSVGERQRIEIIRCLLQTPELIILDEPTSVLTPQEADKLFETLERLRSEGKSILYISHRLEEVKRMCDAATVMRHGKVVGHTDPRKETASSLARMMVGTEVHAVVRAPVEGIETRPQPLLEIQKPQPQACDAVLDAAPQYLAERSGRGGHRHRRRRRQRPGRVLRSRIRRGDAARGRHDPHPRQGRRTPQHHRPPPAGRGLRARGAARPWRGAAHEAVGKPASCRATRRTGRRFSAPAALVKESAIDAATQRIIKEMDVRKSARDPEAAALSGGNLQKFLIGRELDRSPTVMVVNQPTWGVDAGAAARIRQSLIELARSGSAVLVISQDLDELFEISDAIAVMHNGELSKPLPRAEATFEKIGLLMGGAEPGHVEHTAEAV